MLRTRTPHRHAMAVSVLLGSLIFAFGCEELLPRRTTGEKLYRKYCADCHGVDGGGHTIRYMGNPRANLVDGDWRYGAGDSISIRETVRQGLVDRHPLSLQELDKQEVQEIAGWVLTLRGEAEQ